MALAVLLAVAAAAFPVGNEHSGDAQASRRVLDIVAEVERASTECFGMLGRCLRELCVNSDDNKRRNLSVQIMICEAERDQQRRNLPQPDAKVVDVAAFLRDLNLSYLPTFTTIFTNIDTFCFHAVQNAQAAENIKAVGHVYEASELATQHLNGMAGKLTDITTGFKDQIERVGDAFSSEINSFAGLLGRLQAMIAQFTGLTQKARSFENSVTNLKTYSFALGISLFSSLFLRDVFVPTLAVTGVFLFGECSAAGQQVSGTPAFKYAYLLLCTAIIASGLWGRLGPLYQRMFPRRVKCGPAIPRIF
jgi:hypothetical protein